MIEAVAAEHDREIEDDHYGVLIPYTLGPVPEQLIAQLARRRPTLADPASLVAVGWDALVDQIKRFIDVGATKFVAVPVVEPDGQTAWADHLTEAAEALLPLET